MEINKKAAFSLIEVLLAIGILGGTLTVLLALWLPTLNSLQDSQKFTQVEPHISTLEHLIQTTPFHQIQAYTHAHHTLPITPTLSAQLTPGTHLAPGNTIPITITFLNTQENTPIFTFNTLKLPHRNEHKS